MSLRPDLISRISTVLFSGCMMIVIGCNEGGSAGLTDDPPPPVEIQECADWAEIEAGEYMLSNNVWGKGDITDYEQCIRYISENEVTRLGWSWIWPATENNSVKAYPEIIFGWKPWNAHSTTNQLPAKIADISTLTSSFTLIDYTMSGIGNLAYDIWITADSLPSGNNIRHELMIWLKKENQTPGGVFVAQVTIDNVVYDYYRADWDWTYFAFVNNSGEEITTVAIDKFLSYLKTQHDISDTEFVASIEFGSEIIAGSGRVLLEGYRIKVN